MKPWQGSCTAALLVLLSSGAWLFFIVPVSGGMLVAILPLFDTLTGWAVCPGAVSIFRDEYNSGPVTTSPAGMTGHQEEWSCTFEDGSQKVIPNEEIALKGFTASLTAAGLCGGLVFLFFMILAALGGARLVKPRDSESWWELRVKTDRIVAS